MRLKRIFGSYLSIRNRLKVSEVTTNKRLCGWRNNKLNQQQTQLTELKLNQNYKHVLLLQTTGARIVAIISVVVILLSIVIFCLETLPEFKHYTIYNMTSNITRIVEDEVPTLSEPFFLIETTCIVSISSRISESKEQTKEEGRRQTQKETGTNLTNKRSLSLSLFLFRYFQQPFTATSPRFGSHSSS